MNRGNYMAGAMYASIAAGPAFLASLALAAWATEAPTTLIARANADVARGAVNSVFAAGLFGFFLSIVPNIVGSWFMHGLGIGNIAARLPVMWALVGAGAAGLPLVFVADLAGSTTIGTALTFTGASCALVAHRFSTWQDPPRPRRYPPL